MQTLECPFVEYTRENLTLKMPFYAGKLTRAFNIMTQVLLNNKSTKKDILMNMGYSREVAKRPTQCAGAFTVLRINDVLTYNSNSRSYSLGAKHKQYLAYVIKFMKQDSYLTTRYHDIYHRICAYIGQTIQATQTAQPTQGTVTKTGRRLFLD